VLKPYCIGLLLDAMKPGIHCVGTHWIPGFMAFQLVQRIRAVRLMVPTDLSPVFRDVPPGRKPLVNRKWVLVVPMGLACIARSRRRAGRAIAQGRLAGRARGGNTSGDNLVVM